MSDLTKYELARLEYLSYYEEHPENKGGLDDNERVELFNLRSRLSVQTARDKT